MPNAPAPILSTAALDDLERLEKAVSKIAFGDWEEDANLHREDGGYKYRDSQVLAEDARGETIVVVDTLNAHFNFDPDERRSIGEFIAALRNAAPHLLAAARLLLKARPFVEFRACNCPPPKCDRGSVFARGSCDKAEAAAILREIDATITTGDKHD